MKFGIHSFLFKENFTLSDLPVLEKVVDLGFQAIDIVPLELEQFPARQVGKAACDLGLSIITGYGLPETHNPISPDPSIRAKAMERNKRMIDLSVEAEAVIYNGMIHCGWGYITGKRRTPDEWRWSVETFHQVAEYAYAQNPDLVLAFEVVNRFETHFINIMADAVKYVNDVDMPNVKIHADTFHMVREEDNMKDALLLAGDKLGYLHACESHRGVPGRGMVPWNDVFQALKQIGYDGYVTIESFDSNLPTIATLCCIWRDYAQSPEALAKEGLAFLQNVCEMETGY